MSCQAAQYWASAALAGRASGRIAELLLHLPQRLHPTLALLEQGVVAAHEMGRGVIGHLPEGKQGGACTGHGERPLQAVDALTAALLAQGGFAGREHHQLGAIELQLGGFTGGEVAIIDLRLLLDGGGAGGLARLAPASTMALLSMASSRRPEVRRRHCGVAPWRRWRCGWALGASGAPEKKPWLATCSSCGWAVAAPRGGGGLLALLEPVAPELPGDGWPSAARP